MTFLKKLFGTKEAPIKNYEDFWIWFEKNEKTFFKIISEANDIEKNFLNKISPKLSQIREGFFFLAGMLNDTTAELILTADGNIKNIVFVEELVNAAPKINGWKFTSMKPENDVTNVSIKMGDNEFSSDNINFSVINSNDFPDKIDIQIVHDDFTENNKQVIINGSYIFIDNFLGELNSVTTIDNIEIVGRESVKNELISIEKLKDYLIWREKEFIEKYTGARYNTENDSYNILEATLNNGKPLVAVINSDVLDWDNKASHPWIVVLEMKFDGSKNNGMPNEKVSELMNSIEDEIMAELKDHEGYLNIGRETVDSTREIYFACKDFRKPSKSLSILEEKYQNQIEIKFDIYKDKYWESFERYRK